MAELALAGAICLAVAIGCGVVIARCPAYRKYAAGGLSGAVLGLVMVLLALVGREEKLGAALARQRGQELKQSRRDGKDDSEQTQEAIREQQQQELQAHEDAEEEQKSLAEKKRTRVRG